jgi:flagellar motor protein MotB
MQRFAVGVIMVVAGVLTLASIGCVDEAKDNAVLLRNREQEKLLAERDADVAKLNERVNALGALQTDAGKLLQEKEDHLQSVMKERDAVRRSFDELKAAYLKLAQGNGGGGFAPVGPLPAAVSIAIKKLANDYPDLFDYDEATGRLRFKADMTFDSGSNVVKPDGRAALGKLAAILVADIAKPIKVAVAGFTDSDAIKKPQTMALLKELNKPASNQGLSEARAEAVAEVLKAGGVEMARITTKGLGDAQPLVPNTTAEGKAKNRRVELFLSMPGGPAAPAGPATPASKMLE